MNTGWFKVMRNDDTLGLLEASPSAFLLLFLIAYRARRTKGFNVLNLQVGQALVGDFRSCGMARQQYRTATKFLEKHGFATFKSTSKGTIATLTNTTIFDVNLETDNQQVNQHPTTGQPPTNQQPTTIKNDKNVKTKDGRDEEEKKKPDGTAPAQASALSLVLLAGGACGELTAPSGGACPQTQDSGLPLPSSSPQSIPPAKKPGRDAKNELDSACAELIKRWCEEFESTLGWRYVRQAKDRKAAAMLVRQWGQDVDRMFKLAKLAWGTHGFYGVRSVTIAGFASSINDLVAKFNGQY